MRACALAAFGAAACSSPAGTDGPTVDPDALATCALRAPDPGYVYPAGPYGNAVGNVIQEFVLPDPDAHDVALGTVLSQSKLALVSVGAGWCTPCIEEAPVLEQEYERYCGRGLRVVQVLFQDAQSAPATRFFAGQWRDRFGLRFPVLTDTLFFTGRYFEAVQAQTPLTYLIATSGEILFKATGAVPQDLDAQISALLPNQ